MPSEILILLFILLLGGLVSFINSLAGAGSILSLPAFVFLGFSGAEAQATNRFGIFWGALASSLTLKKRIDTTIGIPRWPLVSLVMGSLLGASFIQYLPQDYFNRILAFFILLTCCLSLTPKESNTSAVYTENQWKLGLVFFGIGLYGGFIQVGVGLLMMYTFTRFLKFPLLSTNYLKSVCSYLLLGFSFGLLALLGHLPWKMALVFAAGNLLGGWMGARIQLKIGVKWIQLAVRLMGAGLAVKLLL